MKMTLLIIAQSLLSTVAWANDNDAKPKLEEWAVQNIAEANATLAGDFKVIEAPVQCLQSLVGGELSSAHGCLFQDLSLRHQEQYQEYFLMLESEAAFSLSGGGGTAGGADRSPRSRRVYFDRMKWDRGSLIRPSMLFSGGGTGGGAD